MTKKADAFPAILLVLLSVSGAGGCRDAGQTTVSVRAAPTQQNTRSDSAVDLFERNPTMTPLIGVWEGEGFAAAGIGKMPSLADRRQKMQLPVAERKAKEIWYDARLTVDERAISIPNVEQVTLSIQTYIPTRVSPQETERSFRVRATENGTFELSEASRPNFVITPERSADGIASLQIRGRTGSDFDRLSIKLQRVGDQDDTSSLPASGDEPETNAESLDVSANE